MNKPNETTPPLPRSAGSDRLEEDMEKTFGLPISGWIDGWLFYGGKIALDPIKFERFLETRHLLRADESMADCVRREFGEKAVALCRRALSGERRAS